MSSEAFVTLATNDGYALGALVLAESIRQVGTKRNLVVLISNHLSDLIRKSLEKSFDEVLVVDELNSNDIEHLTLLSRPELGITFTKINCWLLEQYSKCVFLDSDCLVLRSIDNLFEREEFSAAPDAGWPDCFNSGVFVFKPSKETFTKLMLFASQQNSSFDGGDQGLLNAFFSNWRTEDISRHLPFTYNVTANAFYSYLPAVTQFRNDIHVVHFAGALKPWQLSYNPQNEQLSGNLGGQSDIQRDFLLSWWRVMYQRVWTIINQFNQQSNLNNNSIGQQGQFGNGLIGSLNYGILTENKGIELGSVAHRRAWESGHIDYFGRDSFSNIQQQLEKNIQLNSFEYHPSQQRQITPERTTTPTPTSILKNSNKQSSPPPPPLQQTNQTTNSIQQTNIQKPLNQQTTNGHQNIQKPITNGFNNITKTTTNGSDNISKQIINPVKSELKEGNKLHISQNIIDQGTTTTKVSGQTTNLDKSSKSLEEQLGKVNGSENISKQTINPVKSSTSSLQREHLQSLNNSNENKSSTNDHQSNWSVKSTIVTSYTQGAGDHTGPTVVSKVVSESLATSSNNIPVKTTIKSISDSTNSSELNLTAKTSNHHFTWLFDKIFVTITYTISLCYLLFLVAIGRSKNTNIIHENGSTIRGVTSSTNNQNRVKK